MQASWTETEIAELSQKITALRTSMSQVIIGQHEVIDSLLICLLAGGHALVEGVPGLGKTLLVKSLAQATDLEFRRVQFTPDLMPSDIVGTEILEEDSSTRQRVFRFQQGPHHRIVRIEHRCDARVFVLSLLVARLGAKQVR